MYGLNTRLYLQELPDTEKWDALLNEATESTTDYWYDVWHTEVQQQFYFIKNEKYFNLSGDRMIEVNYGRVLDISGHRVPVRWQYKLDYVC